MILANESLVKDYIKQIWCTIIDESISFLVALAIRGRRNEEKYRKSAASGQETEKLGLIKHHFYPLLAIWVRNSLEKTMGIACLATRKAERAGLERQLHHKLVVRQAAYIAGAWFSYL